MWVSVWELGLVRPFVEYGEWCNFMAKWENVFEIELVWPFGGLELGFQIFEPCCYGPLLSGLWTWALKPSNLLLWATAWWALNLSFEAFKLKCCGLEPLKLVGLWVWDSEAYRLVELVFEVCGLELLKLVGLWAWSFEVLGFILWTLWTCLWSLWDCTIEACGLDHLKFVNL